MSATERLRALLDERGVKWKADTSVINGVVWTIWKSPWFGETWAKEVDGSISLFNCSMTPAQAIEATLGRGENEQLRKERDALDHLTDVLNATNDGLLAENAKLRELIRHMYVCHDHRMCNSCEFADDACDFEYDMRELGVEV